MDYARLSAKGKPVRRSEQKDALIELSASGLLPEFQTHLVGRKAGDHVTFDVGYPADFGNEDLRGRTVTFAVQVKAVRERRVRELNDQLAVEVAGMRDLAELRARIRLNMEGEARLALQREQDEALADQLVEKNPVRAAGIDDQRVSRRPPAASKPRGAGAFGGGGGAVP